MIGEDRFKVSHRKLREWPPRIGGYTHLMTVRTATHESAHYCLESEEFEVCEQIAPRVEEVEYWLRSGQSLEWVLANVCGSAKRVAVEGDI